MSSRNIKLTISYDGTGYKGWQLQANGRTVQEELEKAVKKVFKKHYRLHGASRTDAGVHAKAQIANFKIAPSLAIPAGKIPAALNAHLPEDIAVNRTEEVSPEFHARFDAKSKHYKYYILNSRQRDPFSEKHAWRVPYKLNVSLMKREASALLGKHDFKSFQAKDKKERSSRRRILRLDVVKKKPFIIIDIAADGFLYNMVRNIVGTLVDISRGYLPEGSMRRILKSKDRTQAGPTAPAKGLFLIDVKY
jgi:tRNA pseudouridine38-40 synthase